MSELLEREAKTERIELRVTANAKALLIAAAEAKHTTVSEFLLRHGIDAAENVLSPPRVFYASETAWDKLQQIMTEEPKPPSEETLEWLRKAPRFR